MSLTVQRVPIDSLVPDPSNARMHPEENLDAIIGSLKRFGQAEPLVVQKGTARVIAGHGRLTAMRKLGWTEVDIVELDVTNLDATALAIALNRTAELAEWDETVLAKLLKELGDAGSLEGVGFDDAELARLLESIIDPVLAGDGDEAVVPPENPLSRRGDLWILGDHRILCGDSTSEADMARLMAGEKAKLLATDPPYLVDYQGGNHPQSWANKPDVKDKHWDDYVDPKNGLVFFSDLLRVALAHCDERVPVYQWHATRRQVLVEEAWKANGLLVHQTLIWVKARPVLTRCHFMWQHEPCFYGWREGFMPESDRKPPPDEKTVWTIDQVGQQDGIHPTQKPLAIFEGPIQWHTRMGEVVLEPFSGSGTQLVAAEKHGRRCRAMEISPAFVDAAVLRWAKASGKVPRHENGRTWDEVAGDRAGATVGALAAVTAE